LPFAAYACGAIKSSPIPSASIVFLYVFMRISFFFCYFFWGGLLIHPHPYQLL
jgi:hypothetical protein